MRNKWVKRLFRGALILILALVSVNLVCDKSVQASTYKDGTYSIKVEAQKSGTTTSSLAQQFFSQSATATVQNDTASVTMQVLGQAPKLLSSTTVGGQEALSSDKQTLHFSIPVGQHSATAAFQLPALNMHQQCDFIFDWSSVPKDTDQSESAAATETEKTNGSSAVQVLKGDKGDPGAPGATPKISAVPKKDSSGNVIGMTVTFTTEGRAPVSFDLINGVTPTFKPHDDGSGYDIYVDGKKAGTINNGATPEFRAIKGIQGTNYQIIENGNVVGTLTNGAPGVQGPAGPQGPTGPKGDKGDPGSSLTNVSKLNYTVLQSNDKSISEANKYYTHVADVEKLSNGSYKVTMHVQYGKNSGMSAKGFVPLTVNGQKVSNVTYGSTDKNYTASFSFTAKSLDELVKAPVKGTIHVSVPMMGISSDFDVYYKFGAPAQGSNNSSSQNGSKAAEAPGNNGQTAAKASVAKKAAGELPQTSEFQNITAAAIGVVSLILISTIVIYRRKRA